EAEGKRKLNDKERDESLRVTKLFELLKNIEWNKAIEREREKAFAERRPCRPKWRTLIAPLEGGPIFVPMKGKCQQADINAAINIGLRAIAAPENREIHFRIRSERKGDKFFVRTDNLREKARWGTKPVEIVIPDKKHRTELLTEAHPLFFVDVGGVAKFDHAEIGGERRFASSRGIRGTINQLDWKRCEEINRARIEKWEHGDDDVPM